MPTADRSNYYEIPRNHKLLACLACGAVILDDEMARDLHGLLHRDHLDPPTPVGVDS